MRETLINKLKIKIRIISQLYIQKDWGTVFGFFLFTVGQLFPVGRLFFTTSKKDPKVFE